MNKILNTYYQELGVDATVLAGIRLSYCEEANLRDLQVVDIDFLGRPFLLAAPAADAWRQLTSLASSHKIVLNPASGFRSYLYQKRLIEGKLKGGQTLVQIMTVNALPGFSEHHTGCAADIMADPKIPEDQFHLTDTYLWMLKNADRFGFRLSYPQDNPLGIIFEPWHWCFVG